MPNLAKSSLAPILGQRVPLRGPARLLFRSYAKTQCLRGIPDKRLTTKQGDEFDVDLASFLEWQLWAFGSFEGHFPELFRSLVSPGDRCVDVGANVGVHTVRLAKLVGPAGEVIAIEPDEEVARRAVRNLQLNDVHHARVIQAAASDRTGGVVHLYRPDASDTNRARASLEHHSYLTGTAAEVPAVTIDEICPGPVTLIKIDVEGHEAAVIAGATETIARHCPSVIFEYAPELLHDGLASPFDRLRGQGYEMFRIGRARNGLTGRWRLVLNHLSRLPVAGGDILAAGPGVVPRLSSLVR